MKPQEKQDDIIRKLVARKGLEKAPDHFTDKVMGRISPSPSSIDSPLLSKGAWIGLIVGMAAVITVIFTIDIPYLDQLFTSTGIQRVSMNIFTQGFFETMSSFVKRLNLSSISLMIVAAAAGLVVLDRLLRKRFSETGLLVI